MIIKTINDTGIEMIGAPTEKIAHIRAYVENSSVQLWIELRGGQEVMQYLSAGDAMKLSRALDRLAIEALRLET